MITTVHIKRKMIFSMKTQVQKLLEMEINNGMSMSKIVKLEFKTNLNPIQNKRLKKRTSIIIITPNIKIARKSEMYSK